MSVVIEAGTMAGSELGQGCAVFPGERCFGWGDCGGLGVKDFVRGAGGEVAAD